jgi:ABC-type nitrate/sulfonate/bicarbonate transport system substrate-binding protein
MKRSTFWPRSLGRLIAALLLAIPPVANAETVRVNVFPVSQNLPVFVAQAKGFYAKQGLTVEVQFTPNSQAQRDGISSGAFEIAHAGVDNAVALVDSGKADVVIVAGGGNAMNELIVRSEIRNYEDLRGKVMVVDAPNTAYVPLRATGVKAKLDTCGRHANFRSRPLLPQ